MKPLVLTFSEAGQQLMGVSARTIRRMVENGELPVVSVITIIDVVMFKLFDGYDCK